MTAQIIQFAPYKEKRDREREPISLAAWEAMFVAMMFPFLFDKGETK